MKFNPNELVHWATGLLQSAGMDEDKAVTVATVLVEGDLLGHDTHGLALLGPYLGKLADGGMAGSGAVDVMSDRPAALVWDGNRLPGPWLTVEAINEASRRARDLGTATVVIRRSAHIACLAAYLEEPARKGMMVEIHSSDPSVVSVAPFGGRRAVFTPNPIAIGIPASGDPVLIDVSTSITTNGMSARLAKEGKRHPAKWMLDGEGRPSDDPAVFYQDPPGTIQLLGGMDAGHKGYGLSLMVEAMTGALAGYGRADGEDGWGASVMVRVTDTSAFSGREDFNRQMDWLIEACRNSAPIDAARPVRLPGHRGLERKRAALDGGLELHPDVLESLTVLADSKGVPMPVAG